MPLFRYLVTREMGLAKICPYTKFEVSSFTHSRITEGGLKFNVWPLDPDHAPFESILSSMRWDMPSSIRVPNLKFLASSIPKIRCMCHAMADCARGCAQTSAWISVVFTGPPPNLAPI